MRVIIEIESVIIDDVDYGFDVEVDFDIYGSYKSATWYEPEEYPEIEIENVTIIGKVYTEDGEVDVTDEFKKKLIENINYNVLEKDCWDYANHKRDQDQIDAYY